MSLYEEFNDGRIPEEFRFHPPLPRAQHKAQQPEDPSTRRDVPQPAPTPNPAAAIPAPEPVPTEQRAHQVALRLLSRSIMRTHQQQVAFAEQLQAREERVAELERHISSLQVVAWCYGTLLFLGLGVLIWTMNSLLPGGHR